MTFGEWGETKAARYLENSGYKVIERNFRCRAGEIDIIALDGSVLCFIEVKTRSSLAYGHPSEAVTKSKSLHLQRTARFYALFHNKTGVESRIDVIEILKLGNKTYINHIKNAIC